MDYHDSPLFQGRSPSGGTTVLPGTPVPGY
jgi:hypothetical protein